MLSSGLLRRLAEEKACMIAPSTPGYFLDGDHYLPCPSAINF